MLTVRVEPDYSFYLAVLPRSEQFFLRSSTMASQSSVVKLRVLLEFWDMDMVHVSAV